MTRCSGCATLIVLGLGLLAGEARAEVFASAHNPRQVNTSAGTDAELDERPSVALGPNGTATVVWRSEEPVAGSGTDGDILCAFSADGGVTWSDPTLVHPDDPNDQNTVRLATDGAGRWLALYSVDASEARVIAGSDGCAWDPAGQTLLMGGASVVNGLATDGDGTWVALFESNVGDGTDLNILFSRSTDNGVSWTAPVVLNSNHPAPASNFNADLASDGQATWVTVWDSNDPIAGDDNDRDVFVSRSTDDGQTWSVATLLDPVLAAGDLGGGVGPKVAADGLGNWVVVFRSNHPLFVTSQFGTVGNDSDVLFSRSGDDGATWSPVDALVESSATDGPMDDEALGGVAAEGSSWAVVWDGDTPTTDHDLFSATSGDAGATWAQSAGALNRNAATDTGEDVGPRLASGNGRFLAVWQSDDTLGGAVGTDLDLFAAPFTVDCSDSLDLCLDAADPDLDRDGDVDIVDVVLLRRLLAGLPIP